MKKFLSVPFELETTTWDKIERNDMVYYENAWIAIQENGTKTRRIVD